jgi:hypothetical protein
MRERRHREPAGGDAAADPALLTARHRGAPLQKLECRLGGLDHRDRHRRRGLRGAERAQQRHRLRHRQRHVDRPHAAFPITYQQVLAAAGMVTVDEYAQRLGLDHALQTKRGRPLSAPNAGRFTGAHVVVLHPVCHRRDQVLGTRELRDRQHDAITPVRATPQGWQVPAVDEWDGDRAARRGMRGGVCARWVRWREVEGGGDGAGCRVGRGGVAGGAPVMHRSTPRSQHAVSRGRPARPLPARDAKGRATFAVRLVPRQQRARHRRVARAPCAARAARCRSQPPAGPSGRWWRATPGSSHRPWFCPRG